MSLIDYYTPSKEMVMPFIILCAVSLILIGALDIHWIYQIAYLLFNYHYSCRIKKMITESKPILHPAALLKDFFKCYIFFTILMIAISIVAGSIKGQ